jgi:hypothetical protein
MSEESDYKTRLEEWKTKHGLDPKVEQNEHELRMAAEEQASKKTSWCLNCDKDMPVREMKLITRRIDAYVQYDEGETDYIAPDCRVRMCPECFKERYENGL